MTPEQKLEEIERIVEGWLASSRGNPHTTISKILDVVQVPTTTERN